MSFSPSTTTEACRDYQTKVGITCGASQFFIREDGTFKFFDESVTGDQLKYLVWGRTYVHTFCELLFSDIFNLPSFGTFVFSICSVAFSGASAWMTSTSAIVGTEMEMIARGDNSNASITIWFSGVGVIGKFGMTMLSSLILYTSSVSGAFLRMIMTEEDTWSVFSRNQSVVERLAG